MKQNEELRRTSHDIFIPKSKNKTMLHYGFKNYDEFKELFGYRTMNNGKKTRRTSKILIDFLKNPAVHMYCNKTGYFELLAVTSMYELQMKAKKYLNTYAGNFELLGYCFCSKTAYTLDCFGGMCEDGDCNSIRYILRKTGKAYKMKAGKFFDKAMQANYFWANILPEPTRVFLCEQFVQEWAAYVQSTSVGFTLHVDKNFKDIYSSKCCAGDFGSCMTDTDTYPFYEKAVDASAAYITKQDKYGVEKIFARCIVFNSVKDEQGNIYRLAERQYATVNDNSLKRVLINMLTRGGYIDGYKKIGVDCHANNAFVSSGGEDWSSKIFKVECSLNSGDALSYQDSFIFYKEDERTAYNHYIKFCSDLLDTPNRMYRGIYDEYHDRYASETVEAYFDGRRINVDADDLDDFINIRDEWYHEDEVSECPECGEYFPTHRSCHSSVTGDDYCCDECKEQAEDLYKKENWYYCEWDDEYVECEYEMDDVLIYRYGKFREFTMKTETIDEFEKENRVIRTGCDIFVHDSYIDGICSSEFEEFVEQYCIECYQD